MVSVRNANYIHFHHMTKKNVKNPYVGHIRLLWLQGNAITAQSICFLMNLNISVCTLLVLIMKEDSLILIWNVLQISAHFTMSMFNLVINKDSVRNAHMVRLLIV